MGPGGFFPTNPDLADILGDTDFDFENFYFLDVLVSLNFRFPGSQISNFQAPAGLGGLSAGPFGGPSGGALWWALGWAAGCVVISSGSSSPLLLLLSAHGRGGY